MKTHIRELDGLRCLAVLGVMVVHFQIPHESILWARMGILWVGVDLFFVISGFLITGILLRMRGQVRPYRTFYWRRSLRIFPAYFLLLGCVMLWERSFLRFLKPLLFLTAVDLRPFIVIADRLFHHLSFATIIPIHSVTIFTGPPQALGAIWSLSIEELFYLFWAPVVLKGSKRLMTVAMLVPIAVCPILRLLAHTGAHREYFGFFFRIDALMFGALLAFVLFEHKHVLSAHIKVVMITSGSLLVLMSLNAGWLHGVDPRDTYPFASFGYTILSVFFASIVAWCIARSEDRYWVARFLRWRPVAYIGKISYGLYLYHLLAYIVAIRIARRLWGESWEPGATFVVLAVALTFTISMLSWRYPEAFFLKFKDRFFQEGQVCVRDLNLTRTPFPPSMLDRLGNAAGSDIPVDRPTKDIP